MRAAQLIMGLAMLLGLTAAACVLDWDAAWPGRDQGVADWSFKEGTPEQDFLPMDLRPDTAAPAKPWVWIATGAGNADLLDLAVTPDGGVVAVGLFTGVVKVGNKEYTAAGDVSDLLVVKVDSAGVYKWHYVAQGTGQNRALAVSASSNGDIWVVGDVEQTVTFPLESSSVSPGPKGGRDLFVARLDSKGTGKVVVRVGGASKEMATEVQVLKDGTALVAGMINHTASFPGISGPIVPQIQSLAAQVFLAKFETTGKARWVETAGGDATEEVEGMAVDSLERIYLAGHFTSKTFTFAGDSSRKINKVGKSSVFVARVTRDTNGLKVGYLSGSGGVVSTTAQAWGLAVDKTGNAYVTGFQSGGLFSLVGKSLPASIKSNMFVASLDPAGKTRWLTGSTSTGGAAGRGVAMGQAGSVLLAGHFDADFSYPGVSPMTGRGGDDMVAMAISTATGKAHHFIATGATKYDRLWAIKPGPGGSSVLAVGGFSLGVGFNKLNYTSEGGTDGVIWRAVLTAGSGSQ